MNSKYKNTNFSKTIISLILCAVSLNAFAIDGLQFLRGCKDSLDVIDKNYEKANLNAGYCVGYIRGYTDLEKFYSEITTKHFFCIPDNAKPEQLIRIVVKYMEDNPAMLHLEDSTIIFNALAHNFKCNRSVEKE